MSKHTTKQSLSESAIRRRAKQRGLMLQKSRSRCGQWPGYGTYRVIDPYTNAVVESGPYDTFGLSLKEAAEFIEKNDGMVKGLV
jgi:hypothetical protein